MPTDGIRLRSQTLTGFHRENIDAEALASEFFQAKPDSTGNFKSGVWDPFKPLPTMPPATSIMDFADGRA
jgi:hypothetical protein